MTKFIVCELYFRVTYPDRYMCYPGIESFVCLGSNLLDDDSEETWYFQPASDYGCHGSALEGKERPVVRVNESDFAEMLDVPALFCALEAASSRRFAGR